MNLESSKQIDLTTRNILATRKRSLEFSQFSRARVTSLKTTLKLSQSHNNLKCRQFLIERANIFVHFCKYDLASKEAFDHSNRIQKRSEQCIEYPYGINQIASQRTISRISTLVPRENIVSRVANSLDNSPGR